MQEPSATERHLPLVRKIAGDVRRSLGGSVDYDDLVAYGTRGLLEALDRFDASRGIAFSTFAYYRIRGAIYDGVREMGWRGGSRAQRQQARFQARANAVLQQSAEDGASDGDAVEAAITQVATAWIVTLDAETAERAADPSPDAEARLADAGERGSVRAALAALPEKERALLDHMYFHDRSLTDA